MQKGENNLLSEFSKTIELTSCHKGGEMESHYKGLLDQSCGLVNAGSAGSPCLSGSSSLCLSFLGWFSAELFW